MQVIAAITLTDENILEYRVKPDPYSTWDSTTVYRRGRKVIVQDGYNKIYESVYPQSGMYPPGNTDQEQPAWILVRPVNLWSMLGSVPDQRTQNNDEIYLKLAPKARVNAIGVHGVEANYINVKVWDAQSNLVEDRTVNLSYTTTHDSVVVTGRYTDTVIVHLPEHPQGVIEVTLAAPGEKVFCETMTFGEARALGTTQPSARVTGIDPSLKAFDVFGRAYVQKRDMERSVSASVAIPWRKVDYTHKALADLRATPATWVASDAIPISIVYGMYRDFEISLSNRQVGLCNLDIQPIYYEPIKPPAVPVGDSHYWTSRPYSLMLVEQFSDSAAVTSVVAEAPPPAPPAREHTALDSTSVQVGIAGISTDATTIDYVIGEESISVSQISVALDLRDIIHDVPVGEEPWAETLSLVPSVVGISTAVKYIGYTPLREDLAELEPGVAAITLKQVMRGYLVFEGVSPLTSISSLLLKLTARGAEVTPETLTLALQISNITLRNTQISVSPDTDSSLVTASLAGVQLLDYT